MCWDVSRTQTHTIYVVRQLAYSTELLVCIYEADKQYKQKRRRIFSTQLYTQALSTALCVCSLCVSLTQHSAILQSYILFTVHTHIYITKRVRGHKSCNDLCPPIMSSTMCKVGIRYSHLHMVGQCCLQ